MSPPGGAVDFALTVREAGGLAASAVARSGGWVRPLAGFAGAPYLAAGDTIVWCGSSARTRHPRMLRIDVGAQITAMQRLTCAGARIWNPVHPAPDAAALRRGLRELCCAVRQSAAQIDHREATVPIVRGSACFISGAGPGWLLTGASARLHRLVAAYAAADVAAVIAASTALLGCGPGLTPSGDDLVGAAVFGARLTAGADTRDAGLGVPAIERIVRGIREAAPARTHCISAALLDDLLDGHSYDLLHRFVADAAALGATVTGCESPLSDALGPLDRLGATSGWDLFTGLTIGVLRDPQLFYGSTSS